MCFFIHLCSRRSDGSCSPATYYPDTNGAILAVVSAMGGLLVALSILYSGAVGKTVATSASIALTVCTFAPALFIHPYARVPSGSHAHG